MQNEIFKNKNIMINRLDILSLLTGRRIILVMASSGEWYRTIELKERHPFTGNTQAYLFPFLKLGFFQIDNGGCVIGSGAMASDLVDWKYEKI